MATHGILLRSAMREISAACMQAHRKMLLPLWNIQQRQFAARKGKRLKEEQKKKAAKAAQVEEVEVRRPYIKQKEKTNIKFSKLGKLVKENPIDDVYLAKFYKYRSFTVHEVITMHAETHHSTMYNDPDAFLYAFMELDMSLYKKKNKCLAGFTSVVHYPHKIHYSKPCKVLAVCQKAEEQAAATEAGAYIVSDIEIVKQIQAGEVPLDFDYCVTTPDILSQLVPIRGILNKRFPHHLKGSVGFNIAELVDKFKYSIEFKAISNIDDPKLAHLQVPVGKLQMDPAEIEENIKALVCAVASQKNKSSGPPINRFLFLKCPPTKEKFMISQEKYLPIEEQIEDVDEDDDDNEMALQK